VRRPLRSPKGGASPRYVNCGVSVHALRSFSKEDALTLSTGRRDGGVYDLRHLVDLWGLTWTSAENL
jgi:hypothetical protein